MNELVKINNQDLQIKEIDGRRIVTFKDIDMLHERVEGTAGRNFRENKNHFIEKVDYFQITHRDFQSDEIRRFGIDSPRGGILITESGYLMLIKSLTDDLAWKVQRELVNNYFRVKEPKPTCIEDVLIKSLQEMKDIKQQLNQVNNNALRASAKAEETKEEVQAMRDIITLNPNSWRKDSSTLINKIALNVGGYDHIRAVREESYKLLNTRLGVDIKIRLTNKRRRMADEGVCKSKRDKLTALDVIADDKKLIEGYLAIVKEMSIKYKA